MNIIRISVFHELEHAAAVAQGSGYAGVVLRETHGLQHWETLYRHPDLRNREPEYGYVRVEVYHADDRQDN